MQDIRIAVCGFVGGFRTCRMCSCENTNCRELFEKYYEVNVAAFMRTMPAADSAAVRKKAEYALDKMYRIDSTFVLMRGKELDDFIRVNLPAIVGADAED